MADDNIDKALPNVEQTITVPGQEEIAASETEVTEDRIPSPDDVEITHTRRYFRRVSFYTLRKFYTV